jgi:hypothetical protein
MQNCHTYKANKTPPGTRTGAGSTAVRIVSLVLAAAAVIAAAVFAAVSAAWLGRNRDLNSENMAMDMNGGMFELGVPSENGLKSPDVADDRWTPAVESEHGVISPAMLGLFFPDSAGYGRLEGDIVTGNGMQGVISVLNVDGNEEKSLRPGSTGTLEFIIYPKREDLMFSATMSLSALAKTVSGNTFERIDDAVFNSDPPDRRAAAMRHLEGHILFFTGRTAPAAPGGDYSYESFDWIMPGSSFNIVGATEADPAGYRVTLYWEWPVTDERLRELMGSEEVEGERKNYYYYYDPDTGTTEMNATGYNNADTEIGKHISHVAAEFTVNLSEDNSAPVTVTAQRIDG